MAVLGVSCLSGKEVQGEIPEEIAQLWLWCQDLAVRSCWEHWRVAAAGARETVSCHPKGACMGTGCSGPSGTCVTGVNCGVVARPQ